MINQSMTDLVKLIAVLTRWLHAHFLVGETKPLLVPHPVFFMHRDWLKLVKCIRWKSCCFEHSHSQYTWYVQGQSVGCCLLDREQLANLACSFDSHPQYAYTESCSWSLDTSWGTSHAIPTTTLRPVPVTGPFACRVRAPHMHVSRLSH